MPNDPFIDIAALPSLGPVHYLDARDRAMFDAGHAPGAVRIPPSDTQASDRMNGSPTREPSHGAPSRSRGINSQWRFDGCSAPKAAIPLGGVNDDAAARRTAIKIALFAQGHLIVARIASPEMRVEAGLLPHLICSPPVGGGGCGLRLEQYATTMSMAKC